VDAVDESESGEVDPEIDYGFFGEGSADLRYCLGEWGDGFGGDAWEDYY
jgi:hypothetical protein